MLAGDLRHRRAVERSQHAAAEGRFADLAAEKQVADQIEFAGEREILMDDANAGAEDLCRVADLHRLAVDEDLAGIRHRRAGQRLDQRRLSGAVVADHGEDLALLQVEIGAAHRLDRSIGLHEVARGEDGAGRNEGSGAQLDFLREY